jgi:hypothetical protein
MFFFILTVVYAWWSQSTSNKDSNFRDNEDMSFLFQNCCDQETELTNDSLIMLALGRAIEADIY